MASSGTETSLAVVQVPLEADLESIQLFRSEMGKQLDLAQARLLELERTPDDREAVKVCMRALHTIKGTSACLGLTQLELIAHSLENVLSRMCGNELTASEHATSLALEAVDLLRRLIDAAEEAGPGGRVNAPQDLMDIVRRLDHLGSESRGDPTAVKETPTETVAADPQEKRPQSVEAPQGRRDPYMRVKLDRLDALVDMIGELVILQSMLAQDPQVREDQHTSLARKVLQQGKMVRHLQSLSMGLRLVPLRGTVQMLARVVRDLARKTGKRVRFAIGGEDTEIDRGMVEAIEAPLVHMVRNAIDHGVESPPERAAAGKSDEAVVTVTASNCGGAIKIDVEDDGRGLDRGKIRKKAEEKGLIGADTQLTDAEVFALIFEPGFSTTEVVTDVSGRGVGMDVVKTSVEGLRGRVEISSLQGLGCRFTLHLPLTLAVTEGMMVLVAGQRYIVPASDVVMTLRPRPGDLSTVAERGEMLMLRGQSTPIIRLGNVFGLEGAVQDPCSGLILVVRDGLRHAGLLADRILGQQQVVVKPLGMGGAKVAGVAGGAILGDGHVGLVVDVAQVMSLARHGVRWPGAAPIRRDLSS